MTNVPQRGRAIVLSAAMLVALSAGSVLAEDCITYGSTYNPYTQTWDVSDGTTAQTSPPDIVRLPGRWITIWNGSYDKNPMGLSPDWYQTGCDDAWILANIYRGIDGGEDLESYMYPDEGAWDYTTYPNGEWVPSTTGNGIADVVDDLTNKLTGFYNEGWRRFTIRLPAGYLHQHHATGDYSMPSSQYWAMSPAKRSGLTSTSAGGLAHWITSHQAEQDPIQVEVYGGWFITNSSDVCTIDMDPDNLNPDERDPVVTDAADMKMVWQNIHPWFAEVGIHRYWLDAAAGTANSTRRDEFLKLCAIDHFVDDDCYLGGEAIPLDYIGGVYSLDASAYGAAPWIALQTFYETPNFADAFAANFFPTSTELVMICNDHIYNGKDPTPGTDLTAADKEFIAYLQYPKYLSYIRQGIVLTSNGGHFDDLIKLAYGQGFFPFDPTVNDIYQFSVADPGGIQDTCTSKFCDLDGDGDVDSDDVLDVWQVYNGSSGDWVTYAHGDVDGDGDVDLDDLDMIADYLD